MDKAAGTKERIMERNRYKPKPKAFRGTRQVGRGYQTYKKKGDIVFVASGEKIEVTESGWQ